MCHRGIDSHQRNVLCTSSDIVDHVTTTNDIVDHVTTCSDIVDHVTTALKNILKISMKHA